MAGDKGPQKMNTQHAMDADVYGLDPLEEGTAASTEWRPLRRSLPTSSRTHRESYAVAPVCGRVRRKLR